MIREPFLKTRGIHNFRDYGGWRTRGGGEVRTGLLFRSGHHVEATDDDLAAIAPLGIHTVIDLRGESERAANPCIGADRADLVLAGCAILEAIRKRWPSERMRVADRGLREGLLNEMMGRDGAWRRAGRRYRARMRAGAHGEGNRK